MNLLWFVTEVIISITSSVTLPGQIIFSFLTIIKSQKQKGFKSEGMSLIYFVTPSLPRCEDVNRSDSAKCSLSSITAAKVLSNPKETAAE